MKSASFASCSRICLIGHFPVEDRLGAAPDHGERSLADDVVQLVVAHVPRLAARTAVARDRVRRSGGRARPVRSTATHPTSSASKRTELLEHAERLGFAPTVIQGEHLQPPESFAVGLLGDEHLEFLERALGLAERDPGASQRSSSRCSRVSSSRWTSALGPGLVGELGVRSTVPEFATARSAVGDRSIQPAASDGLLCGRGTVRGELQPRRARPDRARGRSRVQR